jgi:hypothetical protein
VVPGTVSQQRSLSLRKHSAVRKIHKVTPTRRSPSRLGVIAGHFKSVHLTSGLIEKTPAPLCSIIGFATWTLPRFDGNSNPRLLTKLPDAARWTRNRCHIGLLGVYDGEMPVPELDPKIQPIDPTVYKACHCGATAKWTASLRLEDAQIQPSFQHEDLCREHAEQFAAIHKVRMPAAEQPSTQSKAERR